MAHRITDMADVPSWELVFAALNPVEFCSQRIAPGWLALPCCNQEVRGSDEFQVSHGWSVIRTRCILKNNWVWQGAITAVLLFFATFILFTYPQSLAQVRDAIKGSTRALRVRSSVLPVPMTLPRWASALRISWTLGVGVLIVSFFFLYLFSRRDI